MRHFIDEVALNLIPSSEAINKTLATILAILIHDCIHKFLKLFYFSRYKPPGLQMTPIQILIPLTGIWSNFRILFLIITGRSKIRTRTDGTTDFDSKKTYCSLFSQCWIFSNKFKWREMTELLHLITDINLVKCRYVLLGQVFVSWLMERPVYKFS